VRAINKLLLHLSLVVVLCAFTDAAKRYSFDIPAAWRATDKENETFSPAGDNSMGTLGVSLMELKDRRFQTLAEVVHFFLQPDEKIVQQREYTVAGQTCWFAESSQSGAVTNRYIACWPPGKVSVQVLTIVLVTPNSRLAENDRVFWQAVNTFRWGTAGR